MWQRKMFLFNQRTHARASLNGIDTHVSLVEEIKISSSNIILTETGQIVVI